MVRMTVKPETALVRPFVVCAVLRGIEFDSVRYNSFIDLQVRMCVCVCVCVRVLKCVCSAHSTGVLCLPPQLDFAGRQLASNVVRSVGLCLPC
jgi:hypothetical protein